MSYPSKNIDTPSFGSKNSSSFTIPSKNTDTPSFASKNSASSSLPRQNINFLITEAVEYLLLESGDRIIVDPYNVDWAYQSKN